MKKLTILLFILCAMALTTFAQKKLASPSTPVKETKEAVFILTVADYSNLKQSLSEWKRLTVYDPTLKDDERVQMIKNLDAYMMLLDGRVKRDSVVTTKPK